MILNNGPTEVGQAHMKSWLAHYRAHVNPELTTRLLRQSVPILEFIDWRVEEVREGFAASLLPLNWSSTNQHGTHQAALIALSADYTGGIALASCLTGVPMAGVHQCRDEDSASLWLADMSVRFLSPSTGDLRAECHIPSEDAQMLRRRFFSGRKIFTTLQVDFSANGEHVARAEMKYFAQPSIQLRPSCSGSTRSPIFNSKLKASARMIAGVRAQQPKHKKIRIDCPHTSIAASPHGQLLANRLQSELPQLTDLVHGRTQHGDETLARLGDHAQVVLLGAGLDMRPFRFYQRYPHIDWFELDLPVMLEERSRVSRQFPKALRPNRYPIAINLLQDDVHVILEKHPKFSSRRPTLVIYEGCSMYFSVEQNIRILQSVNALLKHPKSRLWIDLVDATVIDQGGTDSPEVSSFLQSMEELGEKFVFGPADDKAFLREIGYDRVDSLTAAKYLESSDPVFALYRFVVAR